VYGDDILDYLLDCSLPLGVLASRCYWLHHGVCDTIATVHVLAVYGLITVGGIGSRRFELF